MSYLLKVLVYCDVIVLLNIIYKNKLNIILELFKLVLLLILKIIQWIVDLTHIFPQYLCIIYYS